VVWINFLEKFISDLADPFGCAQGDKNMAMTLWGRMWDFGVSEQIMSSFCFDEFFDGFGNSLDTCLIWCFWLFKAILLN